VLPPHHTNLPCNLVTSTPGFSGADMAALVREAGLAVVRELMSSHPSGLSVPATGRVTGGAADHCPSSATRSSEGTGSDPASSDEGSLALASTEKKQLPVCISARHFESALQKVRPSVALHDRQR
jgi:SpoVK/Ycf46/Vps4 family AAA+-type ATPase